MFVRGFRLFIVPLALLGCGGDDTAFIESFEDGPSQWEVPGSMVITTINAHAGSHSQTFLEAVGGGDAFTSTFPVTPGRAYYLHVAHMSLGGAGFIGIDLITESPVTLRDQWLIGADAQALSRFDGEPGVWKVYSQPYTIPDNVTRIRIKTEDVRDSESPGVLFDDIEWTTNSEPSL